VRAVLLTLALLMFLPRVASADTIGLVVLGDILQGPTRDAADKWLRAHNLPPQANALPTDAIKTLQDCFVVDDARCSTSVIDARATTETLITVRVDVVSKKSKDVRLTVDWFVKKHAPITARRTCENCTENLLGSTLEAMLLELAKNKPGMVGRVKFTSDPPGIPVLFDGETLGVTPLEREVATGDHKARLIRDGVMGPEQDVKVKSGNSTNVTLEAPAAPSTGGGPPPPVHHSRVLPITMIGVGTAAVGAGAVMYFVLNKEPDMNTHFSKDYKLPGMITAGAGAAVALTGVIIILATPNHSGPTVSPTADGGATISWSGRF
jgi:hypothetical protein